MPQSATMAIVNTWEGLGIKSLSHLYKEVRAVAHATSRLKADKQANAALDSKVYRERQWVRKDSITVYSENILHQSCPNIPDNPDNKYIEATKKKVKQNINKEIQDNWFSHIMNLTVQGKFLYILKIEKSNITWKSIIYDLPKGILQFATNACIDSLATNANLKRWGKHNTSKNGSICHSRQPWLSFTP